MTIYTPSQAEKKPADDCPDPEVVTEPLVEPGDEHTVAVTAKALRVSYFQRSQRSFLLHLLITLIFLVILTCGAIGAVVFYRHMNKRVYVGRCGNDFFDETFHENYDQLMPEPLKADDRPQDHVEEHIIVSDIDMYEHLYTSAFDEVRENHVWHDFVLNYTAIVDNTWHVCYLMKLNRTAVAPPRDLIDFLNKLISGYYVEVVRENYVVETPPITNLTPYGKKVIEFCSTYDTYWLDKYVSGVFKRSVRANKGVATYAMFSNRLSHQTLYKLIVHNAQKQE